MTQLPVLSALALKGTILLAVAFGAAARLRRASAASRHFLWTAVFTALLILPGAMDFVPQWNISVTQAPALPAR